MSEFIFNDILLSIPPEEIIVKKESINTQWSALRTEGSIKLPSGFSRLYVQLPSIKFTDTVDSFSGESGFQKLQKLIAQVRTTPFVWVDNEFLRSQIALGNTEKAMMFAVRTIGLTTEPNSSNLISVSIEMDYFNYFPFLTDVFFRKDIWLPEAVNRPAQSRAWKRFYQAEMRRNNYTKLTPYLTGTLEGETTFATKQYTTLPIKEFTEKVNEISALRKIQAKLLDNSLRSHSGDTNARISVNDLTDIIPENSANNLLLSVFGNTTSMGSQETQQSALNKIEFLLEDPTSPYAPIFDQANWGIVLLEGGRPVGSNIERNQIVDKDGKQLISGNRLLFSRNRKLTFNPKRSWKTSVIESEGELIIPQFQLQIQTRVAAIPMAGYEYPTFQCLGGSDASVSLSIVTTSEASLQLLSGYYAMVQDQNRKYRLIPAGQRTIRISNPILNMLGYHEFIFDSLETNVGGGATDEYRSVLNLQTATISSTTQERLSRAGGFLSDFDLRLALIKIIEKDIAIDHARLDPSNPSVLFSDKNGMLSGGINTFTIFTETSNIFAYDGPIGPEHAYYRTLVEDYIKHLQSTFTTCLKVILDHFQRNKEQSKFIAAFFLLTDKDIPGIEIVKNLIYELITQSSLVKNLQGLNNVFSGRSLTSAQAQSRIDIDSKDIVGMNKLLFTALNKLHEFQKATISDEELERAAKASTSVVSDIRKVIGDPAILVVEEGLNDWQKFVIPFIDKIPLEYSEVEQFQKVLALFRDKRGLNSGDCYPDFPLKEILNDINQDKDLTKILNTAYDNARLANKNVGKTTLISPDLYIYNPVTDTGQVIIDNAVINDIVNTVQTVQSEAHFGATTKSWFEGIYQQEVLGPTKSQELKKLQAKARADNSKLEEQFPYSDKEVFHPSTLLQGDGSGLPPSIVNSLEDKSIEVASTKDEEHDKWITNNKRVDRAILSPIPAKAYAAQHDFSTGSINFKPENKYFPPAVGSDDPTKVPKFEVPCEPGWVPQSPNQDFGPREAQTTTFSTTGEESTSSTYHNGLDFSYGGTSAGRKVYASAPGKITRIVKETEGRGKYNGNHIVIDHGNGWTSWYLHLEDSQTFRTFYTLFHTEGLPGKTKEENLKVTHSTQIGNIGQSGRAAGPHLHFEIHLNGNPVDPKKLLNGEGLPSLGPNQFINTNNESLFTRKIDQYTKELALSQGQSLLRAYPTFRLFFIESDLGERKYFGFDDFFSYSSVIDIGVIRSRKIAADLVTLTLTNVSGALTNRKFREQGDISIQQYDAAGNLIEEDERKLSQTDTVNENPLASLMLQPGVQVQLRMGYSSNPEDLDILFNGVIVQVELGENEDIIEITCQSFAIELVQTYQGDVKGFGGFMSKKGSAAYILEELMSSPEVTHFGRWEREKKSTTDNVIRSQLRDDWKRVPSPQDDNIFAPGGRGIWGIFDSTPIYQFYKASIWDVFQEMTFRHPSYIACAVPYEGKYGPRMTMFFGLPDQFYFHRDSTIEEDTVINSLQKYVAEDIDETSKRYLEKVKDGNFSVKKLMDGAEANLENEGIEIKKDKAMRALWLQHIIRTYTKDKQVIKPFRNYHLLTSSMHIMSNSIASDAKNTFNVCTITHSNDYLWGLLPGTAGEAKVNHETQSLNSSNESATTLLVDAGLTDDEKRETILDFPNCVGDEMARQYAVGALWNSMKDGYSGTISIIGNAAIKPYDICYIYDEYSDMQGQIEVEQVVHRFNDNGFVTEITPDMVCHVNQASTMASADAMSLVVEHSMKSIGMQSIAQMVHTGLSFDRLTNQLVGGDAQQKGLAVLAAPFAIANMGLNLASTLISRTDGSSNPGSTTPFGLVGAFFWSKLMTRTQFAHPITYSPLVLNGKPMLGGTPVKRIDNTFIQSIKGWFKGKGHDSRLLLEEVYENISPSNWFGHTQGSLIATLANSDRFNTR